MFYLCTWGRIYNTSFSSQLTNGPNKLESPTRDKLASVLGPIVIYKHIEVFLTNEAVLTTLHFQHYLKMSPIR